MFQFALALMTVLSLLGSHIAWPDTTLAGMITSGSGRVFAQPNAAPIHDSSSPRQAESAAFAPFEAVTLSVDFAVNGAGSNVDTIAFWEAPSASDSLMFVSSKSQELVEVWRYPFNTTGAEQTPLTHTCLNDDTNGVVVDQEQDLLYVSVIDTDRICVFSLPDLSHVQTITAPKRLGSEPNLALLTTESGEKRLYASDDDIVYQFDAVSGAYLGDFVPLAGLETMVGDNLTHTLYIPDEGGRTGVYAYDADGNPLSGALSKLGDSSIFDSDAEGIFVYTCPASGSGDDGRGFIVVSDQIDDADAGNDYEFFDRQTWAYLGKMKLTLPDGSHVYNTDGIASTQQDSTDYVGGLFAAIQDDAAVVGISWQRIVAATGLNCGDLPIPDTTPTP